MKTAERLCPSCKIVSKTHHSSGKSCTGGAREGYSNCFDRNQVEKSKLESDAAVLQAIISSGALGCNHTPAGRVEVEQRLKAIIARITPTPGTCQYCGCTENDACIVKVGQAVTANIPCSWINEERTVCSLPRCQMRHDMAQKQK